MARAIVHGRQRGEPRFFFNYRSTKTRVRDDRRLFWADGRTYELVYPDMGRVGLTGTFQINSAVLSVTALHLLFAELSGSSG